MKTTFSILLLAVLCVFAIMTVSPAEASTITLTAELDKPLMLEQKIQTAYLRIGLTGYPLEAVQKRSPVNIALVIDKSGSMSGERIQHAREAAILALRRLNADDIVSVVTYDSSVQVLVPATKMTNREDVIRKIGQIQASGTTALYAGVQAGAKEVEKFQSPGRVNRVILLSDGHANVGPSSPEELGRLGGQQAEKGLTVTTIGLGLSYNEDLMSRLALKSDGGHYFAKSPNDLASVFDREFDRALSVVAQEIRIEIHLPAYVRPVRVLGREGHIDNQTILVDMGSVFSEHEKYVLIETEVGPGPESVASSLSRPLPIADVKIRYRDLKTTELQTQNAHITAILTGDADRVEKSINTRVAADVVEQIGVLENERATALRDEGKIEQARQVLNDNADYLRLNAAALNSPGLERFAAENRSQAGQLDEANWGESRKGMVEGQAARRTQQ
ncbi:MAG: VWA domain-containing protein [Phycisphaerae bacterium]|nr:VWA domain-containing protein [Phycisphaerae bacterium]